MSNDHPIFDWLDQAGIKPKEAPTPTVDLSGLPRASPGDPTARRYAEAALVDECRIVAECPEGQRNVTLHKAAIKLGTLVGSGHLDAHETLHKLTESAKMAGLPVREIERTAKSGSEWGNGHPREIQLDPDYETRPAFTVLPGGKDDSSEEGQAEAPNPFAEKMQPGGSFLLDLPPDMDPVWGDGQNVLWAPGEALMVVGPPGVGKTTVVQQLVLARCGVTSKFLNYPVQHTSSKVLYLAMDRPRQIARSMRRMVDESHRQALDERLVFWPGPLPFDVASMPSVLAYLARENGADTIVVDSLKDAANGLVDSERAGTYNRARQMALAEGIEVVELAHQRKGSGDRAPKTLADVHGGMEITAGAGSIFLVWGDPGDPVVEFKHLKQPAEMVGPWELVHDHSFGQTRVAEQADPFDILKAASGQRYTAGELAEACGDGTKPSRADIERVRRKLEQLVTMRTVRKFEASEAGFNGSPQTTYAYDGPTAWGTDFEVGDTA